MISLSFLVLTGIITLTAVYHYYEKKATLHSLNNHVFTYMYPGIACKKNIPARKAKALQFKEIREGKTILCPALIFPAVNIFETTAEYLIVIAAPGLERENFSIGVDQSVITISAKKENVSRSWVSDRFEYDYTDWTRAFTLPADAEAIFSDAKYHNGELLIHIPRSSTCENPDNVTIYVY